MSGADLSGLRAAIQRALTMLESKDLSDALENAGWSADEQAFVGGSVHQVSDNFASRITLSSHPTIIPLAITVTFRAQPHSHLDHHCPYLHLHFRPLLITLTYIFTLC
jgi:hypothetical protein